MLLDSYHFWPRLLPLPRSAASGRVGHAFVARSQRFLELLGAGTDSGEQAKASKGQRICDIKSISMVFIFGLGPSQPSQIPNLSNPNDTFRHKDLFFASPKRMGWYLGIVDFWDGVLRHWIPDSWGPKPRFAAEVHALLPVRPDSHVSWLHFPKRFLGFWNGGFQVS
jgi:hypothetical protein